MSENYVIKVDKLKGYQNTLKGEHTNFTNGVRNPFSRGYFYDCSDSAIVTMRNKIVDYMSKIDKGYNNIDSWLDKYMQEFTNVENSLKNGAVRGIYDHDTNMILSKIANKNYVKIEEAIDVIYSLKVKTNKTERINKYNLDDFKIENFSIDNMIKMVSAVGDGDLDIVLESIYGNRVDEYLEISSNLKYYEEYQKTLDSDVKKLEEELNAYIKYKSVDSSSMTTSGGGVGGLINGKTAEIEKGYKEIKAVNSLLEEKNKVYEQFNKILEDRASKDESIKKALNNKEATYEDLYKVLEEKAKTDNELNDILTKKKEIDSKFDNLTSIQKKYIIYLSKQSELAAVNKKIIDLRNDMNALQYRVISDSDEYKEFQKNYSIEDSYKKIVADKAQYQYHDNDYDWFAYYETYANEGLGLKEAGFDGFSLKIGELEAEVDVDVFYKYTTDEEKQMYHFLFNTKGAEAANKYVTSLLNRINEEAGKDLAEQSKKEINYYYSGYADEDWGYRVLSFIASQTKVTEKGIEAGFNQYTRGLESCVVTKKVMTVDEWKEYYESDYIRELGFGYYYDVVTNTSKMLPGMAMGLAGSPVLGSAMYSASIWGSTHDDAIRSGMSEKDAFWYSSLITAEEFATDLLFKATPGLSKVNFDKSFFKRFIKEISGEALQSYYEGAMDCIFKGEEWDLGAVTEESLYSALVAAGSFLLTSGPSAIKSANDIVIKYKMNGQECEIRGKEGLKKVLVEAGIVDNNFDFDSISEFDMNITAADIAAQNGTISEIKINDMNEVTAEKLSKIKYKERVMFTLPDGRMLSFNELQSELNNNSENLVNDDMEELPDANISEEVQEKNINEYDNGTSNIFEDVMKSVQEITDNANQISASNSENVQNGVRAIKSLSEKFGLNNKSNGQFKASLSKLAKLIISNNVGAIKNPFAKFFTNDNFEIPTEGLPKWHKKVIKGWNLKIDNEIGNNLHEIMSDENYVYGVHRTPDLYFANKIYDEGIIMTGDSSSGVASNDINLENNVTMRSGNDIAWNEAMMYHHICEASLYKTYNEIGYGMVVKIPKEYVIFDKKGNIIDYDYNKILYEKNGQKYLKPEFIVAQVEVNNTQILPSTNTKFKTTNNNSAHYIDPEHGYQLTIDDMSDFYKIKLKEGFFDQSQIQYMLDRVNKTGYLDQQTAEILSNIVESGQYDIYIKTVYSTDVPSIMSEGIRCLGSSTSVGSMAPQSINNISLENTVTQTNGVFDIVSNIKEANKTGISQGGNPINGAMVIAIPKGMPKESIFVYNNSTKTYNINPQFNLGFIGCNTDSVMDGRHLINNINNNSTFIQTNETFDDIYVNDNLVSNSFENIYETNQNKENQLYMSDNELLSKYQQELIIYIKYTFDKHPEFGTLDQQKINKVLENAKNGIFNGISREYRDAFKNAYYNYLYYEQKIQFNSKIEQLKSYMQLISMPENEQYRILSTIDMNNIDYELERMKQMQDKQMQELYNRLSILNEKLQLLSVHESNLNAIINEINTIINNKHNIIDAIKRVDEYIKYAEEKIKNTNTYTNNYNYYNNTDLMFDDNRGILNLYGVDQGVVDKLYYYEDKLTGKKYSQRQYMEKDKNGNYILKNDIRERLQKYYFDEEYVRIKNSIIRRGFNKIEASMILSGVDKVGACSYASAANQIFSFYKNNPEGFKKDFGFDMYTTIGGQRTLNSAELLIDMYIFFNDKKNGGSLFENGHIVTFANEKGWGNRPVLYSEGQNYLSGAGGIANNAVDNYLKTKNNRLSYGSYVILNNYVSKDQRGNYISKSDLLVWANVVKNEIANGQQFSLGIYSNNYSEIRMYSMDDNSVVTTSTWNEGGGHAVFITGVTDSGFVVSSWGKKWLIPYETLTNGASFIINDISITER